MITMNQKSGTSFVRFTALLLAALFLTFSLFACGKNEDPAGETDAPATSAPAEETEWPYGATLCALPVREGSLAAGFSSTGETRYVSVGVPVGFGGGYRAFSAQTDNAAALAGIRELSFCDLLLTKGGFGEIPQTSETLTALLTALGEKPEENLTLMDHSVLSLSDGREIVTFFTFSRVGTESHNRSYSFLTLEGGEYAAAFVCAFASADLFRRDSTAATIRRIAESIFLQDGDFSVSLSGGLKTASFSLFFAVPEGMRIVAVSRYADRYAAVLATDSRAALYVNLYEAGSDGFSGDFVKVSDRSQAVTVYPTENGVSLSDGTGGYWSVTGRPGELRVTTLTRTLINAVYSANGKYRAYAQAAGGELILENLNTGVQTTVRAGGAETAAPVAFSSGGALLFSLSRGSEPVGYGVYSVADGRISEYRNGLSPIGIGGDTVWFWETAEGQRKRILKAPLADPSSVSVAAERGGSALPGFFEGYLDILFDSQLSFDRSGEYFILLPADDSRISIFSSSSCEQIYTSAVPNLAEVIPVSGYLILGTQGWGSLYSVALPGVSAESGFSAASFVEKKDASPDYYDFLSYCELASGTLRESAANVSVYEKQNLIYYLLAYAAENGYASAVSTQRYTVSLYHVESILWRLFGLDESYFTSYLNAAKLDGGYPGLLEGDGFNAESEQFEFTYKRSSFTAMERGGCVIRKAENELLVSVKQNDRSGMQRLFSYRFAAFRDENGKPFYRLLSAGEPSALSAPDVSELKIGKNYYAPFWFEVTEGGERAFYPLAKKESTSPATGFFTVERDARARYENGDPGIEFGEAVLCGERAAAPFSLGGIFDVLICNMKTGENRLLSGEPLSSLTSASGRYAQIRGEIRTKGTSYPYAAAKAALASGDGTRLLYFVSSGVDTLACRYYIYDLKSDKTAALSESHTGDKAENLDDDAAEWMEYGALRLYVSGEKDGKIFRATYEWKEKAGKWSGTEILLRPDGDRWEAYTTARETAAPGTTAPVTTAAGTQKPQDTTAAGTETAASSAP